MKAIKGLYEEAYRGLGPSMDPEDDGFGVEEANELFVGLIGKTCDLTERESLIIASEFFFAKTGI
jgi:hypothetical protein